MVKKRKKTYGKFNLKYNFQYIIDYDYTPEYNCEDYDCNESGICRCGQIHDAQIKSEVAIDQLLGYIDVGDKLIDRYCAERILTINKVWEPDNWFIDICNGYYGQEIDGIYLEGGVQDNIESQLEDILKLKSNREKLEYVLNLEYGFLLPELAGKTYRVINICPSEIEYGNGYHKKVVNIERYKNYDLPRGVVLKNGDRYRLIDGYHRVKVAGKTFPVWLAY